MKATGLIRRVDYLGRIIIPKELRCQLAIHDNDAMEIFLQDNFVCMQKYQPDCGSVLSSAIDIIKSKISSLNPYDNEQKELTEKLEQLSSLATYFSNIKGISEVNNEKQN